MSALDKHYVHIAQPTGLSGSPILMQAGLSVAQAGESFAQAGNYHPAPSYKFEATPPVNTHIAD